MDSRIHILNVIGMEYPVGYIIKPHAHNEYFQLYYACCGNPTYTYDDKTFSLQPGDFLLIPPKVTHGLLPTESERLVVLDFKFEINDHNFKKDILAQNITMKRTTGTLQSLFQTMFTTARKKNLFYLDILSNLLSSVLYICISENHTENDRESVDSAKFSELSECTQKVLRYIEGAVMACNDRYLDTIAANLGYNKTYMGRMFSAEMGMSISQYLRVLRLDKAKELLLTTDYDINRISRLVNYDDVNHFIKIFKNTFGVTPEKFRKTAPTEHALRYSFRISDLYSED